MATLALFILAGNKDNQRISDKFDFGPDRTFHYNFPKISKGDNVVATLAPSIFESIFSTRTTITFCIRED